MFIFHAKIRKRQGTSSSRYLRTQNKFPGIIYGKNNSSVYVELDHNKFINAQQDSNFYKNVLYIIAEDKKYSVKFKAIQRHPYKLKILHIDFLYVE